jgi:hypothetical protein
MTKKEKCHSRGLPARRSAIGTQACKREPKIVHYLLLHEDEKIDTFIAGTYHATGSIAACLADTVNRRGYQDKSKIFHEGIFCV